MSEQRLALVTGASRGIGRAVAENLGQAGHIVVGTATSQSGADAISSYFAEQKIEQKYIKFCLFSLPMVRNSGQYKYRKICNEES